MFDDPASWPALEYVNAHTLPCGCRFLLAWQETRARDGDGRLHNMLDAHRDLYDAGLRADAPPDQAMRIVSWKEAEAIVGAKRDHPWWADHVVGPDAQPAPILCPAHSRLPYDAGTYRRIIAEQRSGDG